MTTQSSASIRKIGPKIQPNPLSGWYVFAALLIFVFCNLFWAQKDVT